MKATTTRTFMIAVSLLLASGCTNSNVMVMPPPQPAPVAPVVQAPPPPTVAQRMAATSRTVAQACQLPPEQKGAYATAHPTSNLTVQPERAAHDHVDGCASVKFRLDINGNVSEALLMAEYPPNYDFGDALLQSIRGSKYQPPVSAEQWYYILRVNVYNKN